MPRVLATQPPLTELDEISPNWFYGGLPFVSRSQLPHVVDEKVNSLLVHTSSVPRKSTFLQVETSRRQSKIHSSSSSLYRFLIVDDVQLARKMLRRLLGDQCDSIDEAENGQAAVDLVRVSIASDCPYDIVLMDSQMPIMDGPTAAAAMRRLGFTGLIVGVSGHTLKEDTDRFLVHGANRVLQKPLILDELHQVINGKMSSTQSYIFPNLINYIL